MKSSQFPMDTIIEGPFWPESLRVLNVRDLGASVRIEAVGTETTRYYDQTIPREQFEREVNAVTGGCHTFDAEPMHDRQLDADVLIRRTWGCGVPGQFQGGSLRGSVQRAR